ncbi:hypothetical protein C1646_777015, partial [Rhizophagus diaphanus]
MSKNHRITGPTLANTSRQNAFQIKDPDSLNLWKVDISEDNEYKLKDVSTEKDIEDKLSDLDIKKFASSCLNFQLYTYLTMDNNNPSHNNYKLPFTESNNLQSTDAVIQPEQEYPLNIVATTSDFSMNDDNIFPTAQTSNTNNNYSDHQPISNENTVSASISQYYTSPHVP